jgi:hypothetical protein
MGVYLTPDPDTAVPIPELPLLILVGLTGVGKTSLIKALGFDVLPNRREVVDRYVIPLYSSRSDLDRSERFAITRKFQQDHPGGIAEVLARCSAQPAWPLLFDGLRGSQEITFALEHLPKSYFVVLQASNLTRLSRLLSREDRFDKVVLDNLEHLDSLAQGVLSEDDLKTAQSWGFNAEALVAKLKIVAEEHKNYSQDTQILAEHPRALVLDTQALTLEQEVSSVKNFVESI